MPVTDIWTLSPPAGRLWVSDLRYKIRSIKCWSESKWISFYSLIFRPLAQGCGKVANRLFYVCVFFFSFILLYSKLHCTFVSSGHPITSFSSRLNQLFQLGFLGGHLMLFFFVLFFFLRFILINFRYWNKQTKFCIYMDQIQNNDWCS